MKSPPDLDGMESELEEFSHILLKLDPKEPIIWLVEIRANPDSGEALKDARAFVQELARQQGR